VREKSREEKLAEEKATVTRRIEGWLSDAKARGRAATGKDAYWQAVENHLGHDFSPGSDVLEQGVKGHSALGLFMQQWQQQAASYGATGNPFAGAPGAPGATRPLNDAFTELANEDRGLHGTSLSMMPQLFNLLVAGAPKGEPGPNRLIALVRITLRADGSLVAAELAGTSGNAAYDRLAVARARSVDRLQLALTPTALETLWAFESDLQKPTRSRVRLVAIF